MIDKISQFGHSFQIKSIVCFMTQSNFLEQTIDILDESSYDSDSLKWIVKECKTYFLEYKKKAFLSLSKKYFLEYQKKHFFENSLNEKKTFP